MNQIKLKKSDPKVAWLVRLCYPNYKGRRPVSVSARETYRVSDYWDSGSRTYAKFVHLPTRQTVQLDALDYEQQTQGNPYNATMGRLRLAPDVVVVEQSVFQGKNMGVRLVVHPDRFGDFE